MNLKELLLIVLLALITTWGIEYLFFKKSGPQALQSGQSYTIPQERQDLLKPLNKEIDFVDTKRVAPAQRTEVETDFARYTFTTDGAILERLEFKRPIDGHEQIITTIFPMGDTAREAGCFLVALPSQTPYFYTLVDTKSDDDVHELVYKAETNQMTLVKTFTVFKHSYKMGLTLAIQPRAGNDQLQARIFFPVPLMPDLAATDVKSGVVRDERGSLSKIATNKLLDDKVWFAPTLFGSDNRYFAHIMIDDPAQFTQRAYYKLIGHQELYAILETAVITRDESWTLAFYCGPKEVAALAAVDPQLEGILEYSGWLAFISKLLLKLLIVLYGYLHNYGLAIIALTFIIKMLLLPFSLKGAQSMKRASEMQRKLAYIQQKYKHDPELLRREQQEIMRKHGMPGMIGCLPLLLQIPIFIALSRVLSSSIELYQAPFYGWIKDLSASDPYYILPLFVALSMLLHATTVDAKQRMQFIVMALVFGALSVSFSAGLCLYFIMVTLLGVVQSWIQNKLKMA